jgi:cobalamin biosynthesis protein CobD/CbiB
MSLVSLICALLIEQWRPLSERQSLFGPVERYADFLERQFNAGQEQHGIIAWSVAVLPTVLGIWLLFLLFSAISPLLALAFNVGVLYLTMGFRQFSHYFTDIHLALKDGDLLRARELLSLWRGRNCYDLNREEIARLTIEEALAASHRHVFGVAFWFVLLPGPSGAVLYRLAMFLRRRWGMPDNPSADVPIAPTGAVPGLFGKFSRDAFMVLDWLPVRITAAAFAVVGDFEDAVYCWRTQADKWADKALGIVLAAGAGAIGVRLGMPVMQDGEAVDRPMLGLGEDADAPHLDSTIGLVWRALVLYLLMLLLLGVAQAVR